MDLAHDARVRAAAFAWLAEQADRHGNEVLPHALLLRGFEFDGTRVPLLGPQGIFKPRVLSAAPLSITSIPGGPYDDGAGGDGLLEYRYRGTDPNHSDNVALRTAMRHRLPLVYLYRLVPGKYMALWPAFVVGDDPARLTVTVAVDDAKFASIGAELPESVADNTTRARREYVTTLARRRVHQSSFREWVLDAYQRQCAFCRLRHEELLEAAGIVEDSHPLGEPEVPNGLALCALHHSAFDRFFIGLRPDYVIEVRADILKESDGPTLLRAIQGLHGRQISLPRVVSLRPDRGLVEMKYERFREAG